MSEETLVVAVDFDGCSDTKEASDSLIKFVTEFAAENPEYKKLIVCIASLRQSVWLDFAGAMQSKLAPYASCSYLGSAFVDKIKANIGDGIEVLFEPILTYDVYHELLPGSTFSAMKQVDYYRFLTVQQDYYLSVMNRHKQPTQLLAWIGSQFGLSSDVVDYWSFGNHSKKDICYMLMHHIANQLGPDSAFTFLLIDDLLPMLRDMELFLSENQTLIPSTCAFRGIQCNATKKVFPPSSEVTDCIQGYGVINPHYQRDMRAMRMQSLDLSDKARYPDKYATQLVILSDKLNVPRNSDTVSNLREFSVFDVARAIDSPGSHIQSNVSLETEKKAYS